MTHRGTVTQPGSWGPALRHGSVQPLRWALLLAGLCPAHRHRRNAEGCERAGTGEWCLHCWGPTPHLPYPPSPCCLPGWKVQVLTFPVSVAAMCGGEIRSGRGTRRSLAGLGGWASEKYAFVMKGRGAASCPSTISLLCTQHVAVSWNMRESRRCSLGTAQPLDQGQQRLASYFIAKTSTPFAFSTWGFLNVKPKMFLNEICRYINGRRVPRRPKRNGTFGVGPFKISARAEWVFCGALSCVLFFFKCFVVVRYIQM